MGNVRRTWVIAVVVAVLGWMTWLVWLPRPEQEPVYQGKPLGRWLEEVDQQQWSLSAPATEAMEHVGTNAVPWLLGEASAHDPWPQQLIVAALQKQHLVQLRFVTPSDHELKARRGFTALGLAGGMAVAQGLTNSDKWIRHGCVGQWEVGKLYPSLYLPPLLERLQDEEAMVRARAANALGMLNQEPEKVVPALIKALDDPDHWVRCMAALGLSLYGKQAKSAAPALMKRLPNPSPDFQFFATNALKAIGPTTVPAAGAN